MSELFDTHCHVHELSRVDMPLYSKWMADHSTTRTIATVLTAARQAGVSRLLCIGTSLADSQLAADFAVKHDGVWAAIAIHPHDAKNYVTRSKKPVIRPDVAAAFHALAVKPEVIAIGECGLDYYYGNSPRDDQIAVLRFLIELGLEYNLPFSFHVRSAFDDFWSILRDYSEVRGVVHSFTDTRVQLERALTQGLYIGVNGIVTFTKDPAQRDMYCTIPLQSVLLETDAPFLTPQPFRGKVCESKHVRSTAEFFASLRGVSFDELATMTTVSARALFNV